MRPPLHDLLWVGWLGFLLETRYKTCKLRMSSDFQWQVQINEDSEEPLPRISPEEWASIFEDL